MKIRTGLKNFCVAKIKTDNSATMSETGTAAVEYEEIQKLLNVQNIDLTPRSQSADVDSDDMTETLTKCSGYDGKVQRTMFTPTEQAMLLGETVLDDGTVVSSETDEAPEFATGFTCRVHGGKVLAIWVLRTKYSTSDFSAESAGTDKLNPQSDTISFKSLARNADGTWRIYKECDSEADAVKFLTLETLQKIYEKKNNSSDDGNTDNETTGVDTPEVTE